MSGVQVPPPLPNITIKTNKNNNIWDTRIHIGPSEKLSHTFTHLCYGFPMSRNRVQETVKLQRGLHLYKTGQSKYWYVRILIPRTEKFIRKSTKETNRIDAGKVAYELFQDFMTKPSKYSKVAAPNSFKVYVEKLIDKQRRDVVFVRKSHTWILQQS